MNGFQYKECSEGGDFFVLLHSWICQTLVKTALVHYYFLHSIRFKSCSLLTPIQTTFFECGQTENHI